MFRVWLARFGCLVIAASLVGCDSSSNSNAASDSNGAASSTHSPPAKPASPDKPAPTAPATTVVPTTAQPVQNPPAQPAPAAAANGPVAQFETLSHDFGEVWASPYNQVSFNFSFKNVGNALLKIEEPKPHCGCTVAQNYTKEVPPGDSGIIPITVNVRNLSNYISKTVDIQTNDATHPTVVLEMKGMVKTLCTMDPLGGATFGAVHTDQKLYREVTVRSNVDYPLTLELQPIPPDSFFKITFNEVEPGKLWKFTAEAGPPTPEGSQSTQLIFKTNSPEVPTYEAYASYYRPPRIQVAPMKIVVNKINPESETRKLMIINNGSTPISITSVASSNAAFNPTLEPNNPSMPTTYTFDITLPPNYSAPSYGDLIEIKTTDAEKSVIQVYVLPTFADPTPRPAEMPMTMTPGKLTQAG